MRIRPRKFHTLWVLCIFLLLQGLPFASLALSPSPPPTNWQPPQLVISPSGSVNAPIVLRSVQIHSEVFAGQAQTRIEIKLFNPNNRVLEGELQFPLLEGQIVTGFALDVNGKLRDAVPVPKAIGQEIFEDIRRRRVDPGLLEATAFNQYKLRIYPLPAMGERRVVITVTESLATNKQGLSQWRLPLQYASKVEDMLVNVRLVGLDAKHVLIASSPTGFSSQSAWGSTTVRWQRKQWPASPGANDWLHLALQTPIDGWTTTPSVLTGRSGEDAYFIAQVPVLEQLVARSEPKRISLIWDASGSMTGRNTAKLLGVLDAYFATLKSRVTVDLIVVRNRTEATKSFTVSARDWRALQDALQSESSDGSSNFDTLAIHPATDLTLLATDGLVTDGKRSINYSHTAPVFALTASIATDQKRLQALANRTGGVVLDCLQTSPQDAAKTMTTVGWAATSLRSLKARNLVSKSAKPINDKLTIAGQLQADEAKIDVELTHPKFGKKVVSVNVKSTTDINPWAAQQWATLQTAVLAENPAQNKVALESISARHGLVGPNSSLIVLELAADYARYKLSPPPELEVEVTRLAYLANQQESQAQLSHLATVVAQFDERQKWWDKVFPKTLAAPEPVAVPSSAGNGGTERAAAQATLGRASPPTPSFASPMGARPPTAPAPAPIAAAAPARAAPAAAAPAVAAAPVATTANAAPNIDTATVSLQGAIANALYAQRLRQAPADKRYAIYLDERINFEKSSSFFLDAANIFFDKGESDLGLRVLSNLAELNLENRQLLRLYAYRLSQAKRHDLALAIFERIKDLAPNEPQSWRDLGLTLSEVNQPQAAVDALWEVVTKRWDGRFTGVNLIALAELNAIASRANSLTAGSVNLSNVDARLRVNLPLDLRITMAWDTDDTDMDLHVTDPLKEVANYSNRFTRQGGAMSPDAQGGYGPEEYSLKQAAEGEYTIEANFYGQRQQVLTDGTTVMLRITTNFGKPNSKDEWVTRRLTATSERIRMGSVRIGK